MPVASHISDKVAVVVEGDASVLSEPSITPTATAGPSLMPTALPFLVHRMLIGALGRLILWLLSENGVYAVSAVAVVWLLVVLGYRFRKKLLVVQG